MRFLVDDEEIGSLNPPKFGFWELSPSDALDGVEINPWINGTIMAPFDQPVIIILHKCFQIIDFKKSICLIIYAVPFCNQFGRRWQLLQR